MASGPGGTVCMLFLYLLSHVWSSWTHRSSLLIKANPWKRSAIFAAIPWCTASCHSQLLIMRPCFVYIAKKKQLYILLYHFNLTHLWTWRTTGWGQCRPGEAEEGRTVKKWTHPWSISSSLLGLRYSHGPGSVWDARHYTSARCCERTPHHLHGKDGSVYRKDREGQVLRLRKHNK